MNKAKRIVGRVLITALGAGISYWLSIKIRNIFGIGDYKFVFLFIFYLFLAYLVLPFIARLGARLFGHHRTVTRFTKTIDGLPCDPVNVALVGSEEQLRLIFDQAGWKTADALSMKTSVKMVLSFLLSKQYPTAPFSNLYLAGRQQDYGFQLPIGDNPRKRHHIRFWGLPLDSRYDETGELATWLGEIKPGNGLRLWVGAGTRDTGLGLTKFTWQISHAVDDDANEERDFIAGVLEQTELISDSRRIPPPAIPNTPINQFVTDGQVYVAKMRAGK